jgi:outer membrane murein-binding lipoprotein Lpp
MAGPTTDTLNDDIKDLRGDFHKSQLEIKDEFKRVAVSQAEVSTQLKLLIKIATLGITILAGTLITGAASGIWWASKITYKVDLLESRFDKLESRFDKLETTVDKILEQTKPK